MIHNFKLMSQFVAAWLGQRVRVLNNDRGATAVEYGLMVVLIAVVIIVAVAALGSNLSAKFQCVADSVSAKSNSCK